MPKCHYCCKYFSTGNFLITHMKVFHRCQENGTFVCAEQNCSRNFPNLKTFRKHLKCHVIIETPISENSTEIPSSNKNVYEKNLDLASLPCSLEIYENNNLWNSQKEFDEFKQELTENNILFVSMLYSENTFCRKDINKIMSGVTNLLHNPMNKFKEYMLNQISNVYKFSDQDQFQMKKYFTEFENLFDSFNTEYQIFKYLIKLGSYVPPEKYVIGQRLEKNASLAPTPRNYTIEFVPLRCVFEKFLSLPGVLHEIKQHIEGLKTEKYIHNIVQTKIWNNKISNFDDNDTTVILPIAVYYDDFESGNPLGSHAGIHKIGAVYCSIACLPVNVRSRLENIFLALLFHSSDLKEFGEAVIFAKLIDELNFLCNHGITVNLPNQSVRVHFCVAFFVGDNLALNTLLGFQQSFVSNHFCRFCKLTRSETQYCTTEKSTSLRNRKNYEEDISTNIPFLTGIKFSSSFNKITFFHVNENYSIDIAHDIYEGVGVFVMSHLLYHFIVTEKFFTLETLNHKIEYFNFNENHNKPPLITLDQLKKKALKMSASEMKHFILNAALIFGNLIPEGNKHWELYLLLRKILHIVLTIYVTPNMPNELSELVKKFNTLYLELFSLPLKPKQHFLTHYPTIMSKIGPLMQTLTLRYESKHRQLKLAANVVASRLNITRTLAVKHQLQLSYRFTAKYGFSNSVDFSATGNTAKSVFDIIPELKVTGNLELREKLKSFENNTQEVSKVCVNSIVFRPNDIVLIKNEEPAVFGTIINLLVNEERDVCLIYTKLKILRFNDHLFSFEVNFPDNTVQPPSIVFLDKLHTLDTYAVVNRDGQKYITIF